ncbi:MAG: FAD:protein FMN transferase [Eubacterium sp.]|nr:FAD:protein FMN transferase [Eubacterium sp.]
MKKILSLIICISLTLTLCSCSGGLKRFEKSFLDVFDTASNIVAYDTDADTFEVHYNELHSMLVRYNKLFDIYKSYDGITSLKDVNDNAGTSPVKVDSDTIDLLKFGKEVYGITHGAVNICLGSVLQIWHEYRDEGTRVPEISLLKKAAEHTDINDLVLDEKAQTVYFKDKDLKLDVGAIAKGYAAQKATEYAKQNLWDGALINLGGNVTAYGLKPDNSKWNVQIENPNPNSTEALETLKISDESVVTSGDYQRCYEVDGKRYCHIINPKTLMPAENFSSVSVICNDSALADALSTALFILPLDEGKKLLQRYPDVKAYWVDETYQVIE